MLDEDEDEINVFTLSCGNIPPQCDIIIKVRYYYYQMQLHTAIYNATIHTTIQQIKQHTL